MKYDPKHKDEISAFMDSLGLTNKEKALAALGAMQCVTAIRDTIGIHESLPSALKSKQTEDFGPIILSIALKGGTLVADDMKTDIKRI